MRDSLADGVGAFERDDEKVGKCLERVHRPHLVMVGIVLESLDMLLEDERDALCELIVGDAPNNALTPIDSGGSGAPGAPSAIEEGFAGAGACGESAIHSIETEKELEKLLCLILIVRFKILLGVEERASRILVPFAIETAEFRTVVCLSVLAITEKMRDLAESRLKFKKAPFIQIVAILTAGGDAMETAGREARPQNTAIDKGSRKGKENPEDRVQEAAVP